MIVAFEGFLNCTLTVTDWPGARPVAAGIVMYGVVETLPVAFTRLTLVGTPKKSTCNGPPIAVVPIFFKVTVPMKVWLTRLYAKPEDVMAT